MKHYKLYIPALFALFFLAVMASSCKKGAYLNDGGLNNVYTTATTYDYLKGNSYHLFDTTLLIIDHFNLKDSINSARTFFAFTNYSVNRLMTSMMVNTLDQLYDSISPKFVMQYMFADTSITLASATLTPVLHQNLASDTLQTAVKKIQGSYTEILNSSAPTFNYFTLVYVKVNGQLDGINGPTTGDLPDISLFCQTSGIKTASGTTLHVLGNTAVLNKY